MSIWSRANIGHDDDFSQVGNNPDITPVPWPTDTDSLKTAGVFWTRLVILTAWISRFHESSRAPEQ